LKVQRSCGFAHLPHAAFAPGEFERAALGVARDTFTGSCSRLGATPDYQLEVPADRYGLVRPPASEAEVTVYLRAADCAADCAAGHELVCLRLAAGEAGALAELGELGAA